jgi:hypothetical protein
LLVGGLIFACEFTTNLSTLKDHNCPDGYKPCFDVIKNTNSCLPKSDPDTGCFDGALGTECSSCQTKISNAMTTVCTPAPDYKCSVSSCESGWLNCPDVDPNNCTTDINNDAKHCNTCSTVCGSQAGWLHADPACESGHCTFKCQAMWQDCDGLTSNGCECPSSATCISHVCGADAGTTD